MPLTIDTVEVDGRSHPFFELKSTNNIGAKNNPIHFTGANGFPAATYESFLMQFTAQHSVTAADCRATFTPFDGLRRTNFGFSGFADDLIQLIEHQHSKPVIAMGHSFGAHVSLIAANKRPDLFEKLVLIEPASLPNAALDLVYRRLPKFILHKMLPMIKRTQERQRIWPSPTFRRVTDPAMAAYAQYGLNERPDGKFELIFDPEWEAYIFSTVEFVWNNLKANQLPCLFLRAEHSNLYSSSLFKRENAQLGPHFSGIEVADTYHLMPLEAPEACYNIASQWLAS